MKGGRNASLAAFGVLSRLMNLTLHKRLVDLQVELERQIDSNEVDCEELQRLLSLARTETQKPVSVQQEARKKGLEAAAVNQAFDRPSQF